MGRKRHSNNRQLKLNQVDYRAALRAFTIMTLDVRTKKGTWFRGFLLEFLFGFCLRPGQAKEFNSALFLTVLRRHPVALRGGTANLEKPNGGTDAPDL